MMDVQEQFFKNFELTLDKLMSLLSPLYDSSHPRMFRAVTEIQKAVRNMLISSPMTIDLKHSNLKEGESSEFKSFVKETITGFRQKYNKLFPLYIQVGVTILFQPPPQGSIDLDNLARRIVPFVNEELKPPIDPVVEIDVEQIPDFTLKHWVQESQEKLKKIPKYSISYYQVILLPRLSDDNENGFVKLVLEPGTQGKPLCDKVRHILDKIEENQYFTLL